MAFVSMLAARAAQSVSRPHYRALFLVLFCAACASTPEASREADEEGFLTPTVACFIAMCIYFALHLEYVPK